MNLNELFFFKVFPCYKNNTNNLNLKMHNENNCYFYHIKTTKNIAHNETAIEKDRRREPIKLTEFFKNIISKIKKDEKCSIYLETIFELKKKKKIII